MWAATGAGMQIIQRDHGIWREMRSRNDDHQTVFSAICSHFEIERSGNVLGSGLLLFWFVGCNGSAAQQPVIIETPSNSTQSTHASTETLEESQPPDLRTRNSGEDWPFFLGPRGNSKSIEKGILRDWQKNPPKIVWSVALGESYGICSVSRGRCFQFDRGDDKARLRCFGSETGKLIWSYDYATDYIDSYGYNAGPRCSPVVDGDRVYIYGAAGKLHCVRVRDGKRIWKVDTAVQFGVVQNFFGVGSNPVVFGDLLIAMVGGSPPDSQRLPPGQLDRVEGDGSAIVAFDKFTGEVRYRLSDELASYASLRLATIETRPWAFAFARGGLLGFDPRNGKLDFHFPWRAKLLESVNASVPVVVGNEVLISETYGPGAALLAVKPGGHTVVWQDDASKRSKAMQTHWNTGIHQDGYFYASSGRHSPLAELRCVEWRTGNVMWKEPDLLLSSLLYVDGHFVCLSEDGVLRLIRVTPDSFQAVSQLVLKRGVPPASAAAAADDAAGMLLQYPAWAAPILSHGLLYVRGKDQLVCLELIPAS